MEDLIPDVGGKVEVAIGAASAGAAWLTGKLDWWKNHPNKLVKAGVAVGTFVAVAIVLSLVNKIFT